MYLTYRPSKIPTCIQGTPCVWRCRGKNKITILTRVFIIKHMALLLCTIYRSNMQIFVGYLLTLALCKQLPATNYMIPFLTEPDPHKESSCCLNTSSSLLIRPFLSLLHATLLSVLEAEQFVRFQSFKVGYSLYQLLTYIKIKNKLLLSVLLIVIKITETSISLCQQSIIANAL